MWSSIVFIKARSRLDVKFKKNSGSIIKARARLGLKKWARSNSSFGHVNADSHSIPGQTWTETGPASAEACSGCSWSTPARSSDPEKYARQC